MKMRRIGNGQYQSALIAGAGLAALAAAAAGQTITNGDFSLEVPRNGIGNGWESRNIIAEVGGWFSPGGNPGGHFVLNEHSRGSGDPTLGQMIHGLVPGRSYAITGDYVSWFTNSSPENGMSFRVSLDGQEAFLGATTELQAWRSFSAPFVATGESMLLELIAEVDGTDNDFAVDNINIVPAPGAAAAGLVLAVAWARRRRA